MSDDRLARWAAKGSQPAFAVIFERHHQALHRYCQSIVGSGHDAADALQNTMLKALRALPGETRTIALKPWLYRIAHNESISLLRARGSHSDLDAAAHVGDPGAESIADSRERLHDLTSDLGELTDQQRGALLMGELGGAGDDSPASTQQHALQTAVDRANAGPPAADRPSRTPDAAATPASPRDGQHTSDDTRAGRTAPAAPPQAWQQPVGDDSLATPAPASPPLPAAGPPASPPTSAEPDSTEPAGATAAAVSATR